MKLSLIAGTALCAMLMCSPARATVLCFSFNNVIGNISGTVTGEIDGLNANGTSAATDVIIDSFPAALVKSGTYTTPNDVFKWSGGSISQNSFTLSGGQYVSGGFIRSGSNGFSDQLWINGSGVHNYLDIGNNNYYNVWNQNGAAGVTFTSSQSVPEPASLALVGLGLAGLGVARRRRSA